MIDRVWHWFALNVNPEPWAIGDLSVGRKAGKIFPMVGRNAQLHNYKEAVKEAIGDPGIFIEGPVELQFFFSRRRDAYKTSQARTHRKNEADATNLQKATEDALQGVLFKNDKDVNRVQSTMVEQSEDAPGWVVIAICQGVAKPYSKFPTMVLRQLAEFENPEDNEWNG